MKKIKLKIAHKDNRGEIIDILENEKINSITLITLKKGAIRGNHYHKKTYQWNYLISGEITYFYKKKDKKKNKIILSPGEMILSPPNEEHALKANKKSLLMVFTKGPRGGKEYESDTFRLEKKLV